MLMSLAFPDFEPHPLIRGGHLQTILGVYMPWQRLEYRARQHFVPLPDGDKIALHDDLPEAEGKRGQGTGTRGQRTDDRGQGWDNGDPVVLLLHGLGGCHLSGYMQRCTAKLTHRGYRVFRMDLRGYGAGFPHARHPVHAGRSDDAAAVLAYVIEQCPDSPVHLVGFSMGANIVLKLAGELGPQVPENLASVMAVSPPIDLMECSRNIQRPINRLYDRSFLQNLLRHIERRQREVPGALARPLTPLPRRLIEFDNLFTAPLSGFADAHDYYTRASSGSVLRHITVPTLILSAANDPIIPLKPFETASYSPTTRLVITPCGGHLGFLARRGIDPDRRWLDWRVIEWIESQSRRALQGAESSPDSVEQTRRELPQPIAS
jgi:predicted alpha/beta-fold hydrolase